MIPPGQAWVWQGHLLLLLDERESIRANNDGQRIKLCLLIVVLARLRPCSAHCTITIDLEFLQRESLRRRQITEFLAPGLRSTTLKLSMYLHWTSMNFATLGAKTAKIPFRSVKSSTRSLVPTYVVRRVLSRVFPMDIISNVRRVRRSQWGHELLALMVRIPL